MRPFFSYIGLAALCVCLSLYAVAATAAVQATAMVICADGVAKTIYVNANGAPIEPGEKCCPCLDCSAPHLLAVLPAPEKQASLPLRKGAAVVESVAQPFVPTFARPMPRGPPPMKGSGIALARRMIVPATFDHSEMSPGDHSHRGGPHLQGRPT